MTSPSPRIAVGGIEHETSSFVPEPTPLDEFLGQRVDGTDLASRHGANTVIDGFVDGVERHGFELVPLCWFKGISGGPATRETFDRLLADLLEPLRAAIPVDGVLLSLHGAFAAEDIDDADGAVLGAVRELVGPDCPILAVHDMHCNLSERMVDPADVLVVMRTYPHVDMHERAGHAVDLLAGMLDGRLRPTMAWRPLPLLWSAPRMISGERPMSELVEQLGRLDDRPGVLSASLGVGYQWIDSPTVGAAAVVVTDDDAAAARTLADELAGWTWDRREDWVAEPLSPVDALEAGEAAGRYPILLADQADNTGGGAPGDSTELLRLFLERKLDDAAVLYLVDPAAAAAAHDAGVNASLELDLGGHSHERCGPPVPLAVTVEALSDGRFVYDGPMWADVADNMGPSALLRHGRLQVVVISRRRQPIDLAFARSLGLDCRRLKYIAIKSTGHFRSGFEPIAGSIFNVDAAGLFAHDYAQLPYSRLGRPIWPLDPDAVLG